MAIINTNTVFGLFKAGTTPFEAVSGSEVSISCDKGKDPVLVLVDLTGASDSTVTVLDAEGKQAKAVELTGGALNVIPVTTAGIIDAQGNINLDFESETEKKIAAVIYTPVINY